MDKLVIIGGRKLSGCVKISGAKNAALPVMAATLLSPGQYIFHNVPELRDVRTMSRLLSTIGANVEQQGNELRIDSSNYSSFEAPYELVKTMRASIYVLGPLLARNGFARVSLPGGCAWGPRPVNFHLEGLCKMGAKITLEQGYIVARAKRLKGAFINFDIPSVGATGNLMMAATLAEGKTIIENAAKEPDIVNLANVLLKMGAHIKGVGTERIEIDGVEELHPAEATIIPDRIETATFLIAGAITGGKVTVENVNPDHVTAVLAKLQDAGLEIKIEPEKIHLRSMGKLKSVNVTTAVYPGFPTDVQAQWMALMCVANGVSVITDTIYPDRFTHVAELQRLGADIKMDGNVAAVKGVPKLLGATVMSTDLRASASLILAGLVAEGRTDVLRVYHIDRGYEKIEEKLKTLGAEIRREEGPL